MISRVCLIHQAARIFAAHDLGRSAATRGATSLTIRPHGPPRPPWRQKRARNATSSPGNLQQSKLRDQPPAARAAEDARDRAAAAAAPQRRAARAERRQSPRRETTRRRAGRKTSMARLAPGYWGPSQGWRATLRSRPRRPLSLSLRGPRDHIPRFAFYLRAPAADDVRTRTWSS